MASNSNIPTGPVLVPVPIFDCDQSPSYVEEDNNTVISQYTRELTECQDIPMNTQPDFFNCNLCGSDERYAQPMIAGDVLRIQIPTTNNTYKSFSAYLFDENSELVEDVGGIQYFTITDGFKNRYLDIILTADSIVPECFYVKIYGWESDIDTETLDTCVEAGIGDGLGPKEADILCRISQSPAYQEFYSEQYRKVDDACEDTLLIEGFYQYYDCDGNFYGSPQTQSGEAGLHEAKIRIPGTIERTEYAFEETLVFNTRRTSKQSDTYLLRTEKLPPYVVKQLAIIFNSKYIRIDGILYKGGVRLSKNYDEGSMWIISTTLKTECDTIDFLCS